MATAQINAEDDNVAVSPIVFDIEEYEELCEMEVTESLGINIVHGSDERPVLDFSFARQPWTEERLLQVTSLYSRSYRYSFELLLEVLVPDDDDLVHVARQFKILLLMYDLRDSATADWLGELRKKLPDALVPLIDLRPYQDFLRCCWSDNKEPASAFERLPLMQKRLKSSKAFRIFMDVTSRQLQPYRFSPHGNSAQCLFYPPFTTGLRRILSQQLIDYQEKLLPAIRSWFPPERDQKFARSRSIFLEKSGPLLDVAHLNFAFAPSGSGKTTSIFNKLMVEYGHYMVASALGSQESDPEVQRPNIMDPKILQGVSKDTRELLKMLKYIEALDCASELGLFLIPLACKRWWSLIFKARSIVFGAFLKAKGPQSTPEMWLSFQINCQDWDPFLQVFRAMAFSLDHRLPTRLFFSGVENTRVAWTCIDEAQEDLRYEKGPGDNLFGYAMGALYSDRPESLGSLNAKHVIFAGTSFNISKALETRQKQIGDVDNVRLRDILLRDNRFRLVTNYQHVRNNTDAETILQDYGLKAKKVLQIAPQYGRLLRGRVKWTAMFAERILDALKTSHLPNSEERELSEEQCKSLDLRKVADDTYENIVEQLSDKLHIIRGRENGEDLLRVLLEAAISADIRNSSHTFERKCDLELVEHGFATVAHKIDKAKDELEANFITTFNSMRRFELTAQRREHCAVENGIIDLLVNAAKIGFSVNGWILNELTPDMWNRGFTVVDYLTSTGMLPDDTQTNADNESEEKRARVTEVINELGQQNKSFANYVDDFITLTKSNSQRLVNMKIKSSFHKRIATELALKLKQSHFLIIDKTIDELNKLVKEGFTVRDMDSSPIAELKERVVIEAVIRFSTVSNLENSLLPRLKNLSRPELGGPAEYYLAVQLQSFFRGSTAKQSPQQSEEWQRRRDRAVASLARAQNRVAGQVTQIQGLPTSSLITGEQTVKKSDSWEEWIDRLRNWLDAIQAGDRPCASFLLPHSDFGPDLIFALRKTDKHIILCSAQLKLGTIDSGDAVNKSSISWACVGRRRSIDARLQDYLKEKPQNVIDFCKRPKTLSEEALRNTRQQVGSQGIDLQREANQSEALNELEQQLLGTWRNESKLSLLITAEPPKSERLKTRRPDTKCNEAHEYYNLISGDLTSDLFGKGFWDLLFEARSKGSRKSKTQ